MHTKNKKSTENFFAARKYRQSAGDFVFSIGAMTVIQPYGRITIRGYVVYHFRMFACL